MRKFVGVVILMIMCAPILQAQGIQVWNTNVNHRSPYWLAENVLVDSTFLIVPFSFQGTPLTQPATNQVGIFSARGTTFPIDSGIVMHCNSADGVTTATLGTNPNTGPYTDAWLTSVLASIGSTNRPINDRVEIIFSFIATSDSIEFNYVFGSHEYPQYTCSAFNDVFGFFLKGYGINGNAGLDSVNLANIPGTTVPVAINTINQGFPGSSGNAANCLAANPNYAAHSVFYNAGNAAITSLGGYTTKFKATAQVTCGNFYEIRLAIANVQDHILPSAVFLEANSFKSPAINISSNTNSGSSFQDSLVVEGCKPSHIIFEKDGNKNIGMPIKLTYTGNAINGVDVVQLPDSIWIPPGQTHDTLFVEAFDDGIAEPNDSLVVTMLPVQTSCYAYPPQQKVFYLRDRTPLISTAVAVGRDTIQCPGDTATIQGTYTGNEGIAQFWWTDDSSSVQQRVVSPQQTTTYYFNVIDECSADTITDSVTIYLANYVPMTYNVDSLLICRGDSVSFNINVQDGRPPYAYEWFDGSTNSWYKDVPTADTTFYPFLVFDACGIMIRDSMMARISPDPVAGFVYWSDMITPLTVEFTNRSRNAASWLWDFGNGQTSTDEHPIWDFERPGIYPVTLTITNQDGCIDVTVIDVTVETYFFLYVPTAFTPDGDGLNECFEVKGVGFDSFEMKVFDRWGNQVFYTDHIEECWDGLINGQMAPQGSYTYTIFLRLPFGEIHQRQGAFTVYR